MAEDQWRAVLIQTGPSAPPFQLQNEARAKTFGTIADAVGAISERLYSDSVRSELRRKFNDPGLQKRIASTLAERRDWGVLIVFSYYEVMSSGGPRYYDIVVSVGSAAPNADLAIEWEKRRPKLYPGRESFGKPLQYKYDYLWIEPSGGRYRRVADGNISKHACVATEMYFKQVIAPRQGG